MQQDRNILIRLTHIHLASHSNTTHVIKNPIALI